MADRVPDNMSEYIIHFGPERTKRFTNVGKMPNGFSPKIGQNGKRYAGQYAATFARSSAAMKLKMNVQMYA